MERCSTFHKIGNCKLKTRYTPIKIARIRKTLTTLNADKDVEQQKVSFIAGWECKMVQLLLEEGLAFSYKCDPPLTLLDITPHQLKTCQTLKNLFKNVYSSFIHNFHITWKQPKCFQGWNDFNKLRSIRQWNIIQCLKEMSHQTRKWFGRIKICIINWRKQVKRLHTVWLQLYCIFWKSKL